MAAGCGGRKTGAHPAMDRRQFLCVMSGAATLLGDARTGHAECGEPSNSTEFVEMLYQEQVRLLAAKTPLGEDDFHKLFAPDLRKLMKAPRRDPDNQPDGPIFNAFFGWGVLPGTEVTVGDNIRLVSGENGSPATVGVGLKYRGERHRILVHVVREAGVWLVANIIYDRGKSLVSHYRAITGG
jgi:hypothetical protein